MILIKRDINMKCFVIFIDSNVWDRSPADFYPRFWVPFLKRGYRHCSMLIPLYDSGRGLFKEEWTLAIDPGLNVMEAIVYDSGVEALIEQYQSDPDVKISEVLECTLENSREIQYSMELLTCVTIIKKLLGRKWRFVQTPWQLRKKLISSGLAKDPGEET